MHYCSSKSSVTRTSDSPSVTAMSSALIVVPVMVPTVVIVPISPLPPGAPPLIAAAVADPSLRWRWRPTPTVILTLLLPIVFG